MIFTTLFSTFCLLAAHPSFEILYNHHLETAAGRTSFLTDKLAPYVTKAAELNGEVQALAVEVEALSPENDQHQIIHLTQEMTQKMGELLTMLPILNTALSVDKDFGQIDHILHQEESLSPEQQETLDRIASLCTSVEIQ